MAKIGIIGGSGLDDPEILKDAHDDVVTTHWGEPSSPLRHGAIEGVECVLLARHGRQHTLPPTHVPNRANIQALVDAGCTHILSTTAVGSLRKKIGRGDLVIVDQFIDFTRFRNDQLPRRLRARAGRRTRRWPIPSTRSCASC